MKLKKDNNWDKTFVFTFDPEYVLTNGRFALNKIFKNNNNLQGFLFYLHKKFYMEQILTVNELKNKTKILKKSFEKLNKTQLNCMKNNPDKKAILENCGDNSIYQIPLDEKPRLFGFFKKNCFYIVAYDPEHQVFPSKK